MRPKACRALCGTRAACSEPRSTVTGLPPVTGDTGLAVNLGSLDGTASFTSLKVHTRGTSWTFSDGSLHYPFELSDEWLS